MASDTTKDVVCKKCGFCFCAPKSMKESDGCYTPLYCESNQDNPKNKFKIVDEKPQ